MEYEKLYAKEKTGNEDFDSFKKRVDWEIFFERKRNPLTGESYLNGYVPSLKIEETIDVFICEICGKEFKAERFLKAHKTRFHKDTK